MINRRQISTALLFVIKIGICFILFLPLVMSSGFFFPFIVPKNVLFRIAVEIIFIAYLALAHVEPAYRLKFDKLFWAVTAFIAASVVAMFLGIGWYSSFWGNYERMSGVFHLLHLYLFFVVIVNAFRSRVDWHSFFTFSLFASVLMTLLGFAQYLNIPFLLKSSGGTRLSGTVGNATFFAAYLLFHLFILMYFWAKEDRFNIKLFAWSFLVFDAFLVLSSVLSQITGDADWGWFSFFKAPILTESFKYPSLLILYLISQALLAATWFWRGRAGVIRAFLAAVFLFELVIFFDTQTRGAIIGLVIAFAFLAVVSLFVNVNKKIKQASGAVLFLLVISPFILLAMKNSSFVQHNNTLNRLANISFNDTTTQSRLLTWQASWKGWAENPKTFLFGYGPENYYYVFNKYFPSAIYRNAGSQVWFDRAHNIIFDTGVTTGMIGLLAYLSILGIACYELYRIYRQSGSMSSSWLLIALLLAYFGQDFFVFDTVNTEILLYLFVGFIAVMAGENRSVTPASQAAPVARPVNYIYLSTLIIILLFGVFAINVKTLQANNYIYQALVDVKQTADYDPVKFDLLKNAIDQAVVGKFEARQQLADYASTLVTSPTADASQALGVYNYAVAEMQKSIVEEPLNIRHVLWLATLYNNGAAVDRAAPDKNIAMIEKAIPLSPTRQQVYFELGQAYALRGDLDNAIANFQRGVDLSPDVLDSHWNLLALYIVGGKNDLADQEYQTMLTQLNWTPTVQDYQRLIALYNRTKQYQKMIDLENKLIALEPSAPNYAQLAALYAKIGDNQKAREATQKAIELDPSFAAEAQNFLKQLDQGVLKVK